MDDLNVLDFLSSEKVRIIMPFRVLSSLYSVVVSLQTGQPSLRYVLELMLKCWEREGLG